MFSQLGHKVLSWNKSEHGAVLSLTILSSEGFVACNGDYLIKKNVMKLFKKL